MDDSTMGSHVRSFRSAQSSSSCRGQGSLLMLWIHAGHVRCSVLRKYFSMLITLNFQIIERFGINLERDWHNSTKINFQRHHRKLGKPTGITVSSHLCFDPSVCALRAAPAQPGLWTFPSSPLCACICGSRRVPTSPGISHPHVHVPETHAPKVSSLTRM